MNVCNTIQYYIFTKENKLVPTENNKPIMSFMGVFISESSATKSCRHYCVLLRIRYAYISDKQRVLNLIEDSRLIFGTGQLERIWHEIAVALSVIELRVRLALLRLRGSGGLRIITHPFARVQYLVDPSVTAGTFTQKLLHAKNLISAIPSQKLELRPFFINPFNSIMGWRNWGHTTGGMCGPS